MSTKDTVLYRWRAGTGFTQADAAAQLGMSRVAYQALEAERDFKTGKPVKPDRRTLLACQAILSGLDPYQ